MAGKNTAVCGIYPSVTRVAIGMDELKAGGFRNTVIPTANLTSLASYGA